MFHSPEIAATKVDRRAVMTRAWEAYREQCRNAGNAPFNRKLFARWLAIAWNNARAAIVRAQLAAAQMLKPQRVQDIEAEMQSMEYGERIDWDRHRALTSELNQLSGRLA